MSRRRTAGTFERRELRVNMGSAQCRAMHGGEAGDRELAQACQRSRAMGPRRDIAQTLLQCEDFLAAVILCHCFALAAVRAQVRTKESLAMCLIEQNGAPVVGKVRGLEHLQPMRTECNAPLVCDSLGWP